jgi:beta-lactamase regulating signal transducer with metallopeptidase domain/transcription termination factor NusB
LVRNIPELLLNPLSLNLKLESPVARITGITLLAVWAGVAGFRIIGLFLQLYRIRKLKQHASSPSAELDELFKKLIEDLSVNRRVELKVSRSTRSAFLLGFVRPTILLPANATLQFQETELVLRHELAHLQRRDDWANLIQHFILAACFFHPAAWWICRRLSLEREIACDDHVLERSGRPKNYALVLANLAGHMERSVPLVAPGSSNNKTQLKERIDMILNRHRNSSPRLAKTWLVFTTSTITLLAAAMASAGPRITLAPSDAAAEVANASPGNPPAALLRNGQPVGDAEAHERTTPDPTRVGAGPKVKSHSAVGVKVQVPPSVSLGLSSPTAVVAVTPAPAPSPSAPAEPAPAAPPAPPVTRWTPHPARLGPVESSLEQRLHRLEEMVDSLMNRSGSKSYGYGLPSKPGNDAFDQKDIAELHDMAKRQADLAHKHAIDPKEMEKIRESAQRQAKLGAEAAKRAAANMEKNLNTDKKPQEAQKSKEGALKQLEAVRKQLQILEREKEKLDAQIEKLEADQERLEELDNEEQAALAPRLRNSAAESLVQPLTTF